MPDTPKEPEAQSSEDQSPETISDLPNETVADRDAEAVKGGARKAGGEQQ